MGFGPGVRAVADNVVEITFQYKGQRCRERVSVTNARTATGILRAVGKKHAIDAEIDAGTFDYAKHFPRSKRALRFSQNPGALVTMATLFEEWLAVKEKTINPEQWGDMSEYVRHTWLPFLDGPNANDPTLPDSKRKKVTDVDLALVQNWVDASDKGIKRIRALLGPLRQALKYAQSPKGYIARDPLEGLVVKRVKATNPDDALPCDPFSAEEVLAICSHLHPMTADMVVFWVWSGLRYGEIAALEWADINWQDGTVYISKAVRGERLKDPKTATSLRHVDLRAAALRALERQRERTEHLGAEVWMNPLYHGHGGPYAKPRVHPWTGDKRIGEQFRAACLAAGVRPRTPRQCRHTFASWMLSSGEMLPWVSRQLGHSNVTVTAEKYARWVRASGRTPGQLADSAIPFAI